MNTNLQSIVEEEGIDFEVCLSQQFATVLFDRKEDSYTTHITVIRDGKVKTIKGDNEYNPSQRRHASCVYIREEDNPKNIIKVCTIQHKGITLLEVHQVVRKEYLDLFSDREYEGGRIKGKSLADFDTDEEYFAYFHSKNAPK